MVKGENEREIITIVIERESHQPRYNRQDLRR